MFVFKIINIYILEYISGVFNKEWSLGCIIHIFEGLAGLKN